MQHDTTRRSCLTIGLDLGSRSTQCAVYSEDGERQEERKVATSRAGLEPLLRRFPGARVVMEASTPSRWIKALAEELGHEVIIANPRMIPIITASVRKCDRNDARLLAELGQVRPQLLNPVELRDERYQMVRTQLFARSQVVKQRTALVNFIRSEVKALGQCLPSCSTNAFASKIGPLVPEQLRHPLGPILDLIRSLTEAISEYDKRIEELSRESFPQTRALQQVHGVGPLIALAFVATIGDPERFSKSRKVGPYLGLVPRLDQSGRRDPSLSITKCGDRFVRSLLVSAATRILGPHGVDSDLRRFGLRVAGQGGKRAKARARIAVARKLATVLHSLLLTGEVYEPLRNSAAAAAAA